MVEARFCWDDDAVTLLLRLHGDGESASGIAAALAARGGGAGPSRNAVLGKLDRLRAAGAVARLPPPPRGRAARWSPEEDAALAALVADGLPDRAVALRLGERFARGFAVRAVEDRRRRLGLAAPGRPAPGRPAPGRPAPGRRASGGDAAGRTHARRGDADDAPAGSGVPARSRERDRRIAAEPAALRPSAKRMRAQRRAAVAAPIGVGLADLAASACRWPLWRHGERPGAAGLYCGAPAEASGSYCAGHARLAYVSVGEPAGTATGGSERRTA